MENLADSSGIVSLGAGNYLLGEDISGLNGVTTIKLTGAVVNLCLNGHTLDLGQGYILVGKDGELNICDCNGQGVIKSDIKTGAVIETDNDTSVLHLYGGKIYNSEPTADTGYATNEYGRGIFGRRGKVYIYGGSVHSDNGVAVINTSGTVNISGGNISSNRLHAVVIGEGSANITGGTISYNGENNIPNPNNPTDVVEYFDQSAIYVIKGTVNINGKDVNILGNKGPALYVGVEANITFTNGSISSAVSGVECIYTSGKLTINGPVKITGKHYGIFNDFSTGILSISDGEISSPVGIYNKNGAQLYITDSPKIVASYKNADIAINSSESFIIPKNVVVPGGSDPYAVYTYIKPQVGAPIRITSGWAESGMSSATLGSGKAQIPFISSEGYIVREMVYEGTGKLELYLVVPEITGKIVDTKGVENPALGTLTFTDENGAVISGGPKGTKVYIDPHPSENYALVDLVATWHNGSTLETKTVKKDSSGKYVFTMPVADVTLTATMKLVHKHPMSTDCTTGTDVDFNIFLTQDSITSNSLKTGAYVLMSDITYQGHVMIRETVDICLNGYTLEIDEGHIELSEGAVLRICTGDWH